jgi:hypothetical protein
MTLPTFLVIGAMKAGTTSLWSYLRAHPQVRMSDEKELDFFVAEKCFDRGLGWYEAQFEPVPAGTVAVGEASTNYTKHPLFDGVPARAAAALPHAKIVYVVRQPFERMRSHWFHARAAGWEHRSFARAITTDPQYVDVSSYGSQLARWLEHFPRDQIAVHTSEQLRADRAATIARLLRFLGVDEIALPVDDEAHRASEKPAPRRRLATMLAAVPGASHVARVAPAAVRREYGRRTTISVERDAVLPGTLERELREHFAAEAKPLRSFLGGGFDCWGLA